MSNGEELVMSYDTLVDLFNTYKFHIFIYTTIVIMGFSLGYTMSKNRKEDYLKKQQQIEQEKNDN